MIIGAIGSIEYEPGGKEGGDGGVDNLACPSGGWRRLRGGLMGGGGGGRGASGSKEDTKLWAMLLGTVFNYRKHS